MDKGAGNSTGGARRVDPMLSLMAALAAVVLGVAAGPLFSLVYDRWLADPVGHAAENVLEASGYSRFQSGRP